MRTLLRHGEADQPPAVPRHEVYLLWRRKIRRDDEVTLILAVFGIDQNEHPPIPGILDDLVDRGDRVLELV
jgi:hypothetical protein